MTNENAIKQLKRMKMDKSHTGDEYNAIMTAIKALEEQPFMNKPCISEGVCHDAFIRRMMNDNAKRAEAYTKEEVIVILDGIRDKIERRSKWSANHSYVQGMNEASGYVLDAINKCYKWGKQE